MTKRILVADLDAEFARLKLTASRVGIDTTDWRYTVGSKLYGNTFNLYKLGEHGSHSVTVLPGFLGWTKREAFERMRDYCQAFSGVEWANRPTE